PGQGAGVGVAKGVGQSLEAVGIEDVAVVLDVPEEGAFRPGQGQVTGFPALGPRRGRRLCWSCRLCWLLQQPGRPARGTDDREEARQAENQAARSVSSHQGTPSESRAMKLFVQVIIDKAVADCKHLRSSTWKVDQSGREIITTMWRQVSN